MVCVSFKVVAILSCLALCCHSRPMGGILHDVIYSLNSSKLANFNGTCHEMGLYNSSTIKVDGTIEILSKLPEGKNGVNVTIGIRVFGMKCANFLDMPESGRSLPCGKNSMLKDNVNKDFLTPVASAFITRVLKDTNKDVFILHPSDLIVASPPTEATVSDTDTEAAMTVTTTVATTAAATKPDAKRSNEKKKRAGDDDQVTPPVTNGTRKPIIPVVTIGNDTSGNAAGMYLLQVYVARSTLNETISVMAHVNIEMRNPHGYLSAIDYPALVFYGLMTSVYAIYGIAWIIMMLCSFSDLVRLQFWVMAVIILGFLEKTFFVAEYSAINLGNDTYGSYVIAEFVSAVKRGLSRMLLIIVAMGFGTVKPRLGDSLFKVVAAGVAYFSLALVDGIMRSRANTFHTSDTSSVVTLALLLLLDTFIFYWIFTAIVDTRRTLRLRKNYVKLAMYNHFAYTLIFAVMATVAFVIWVLVALEYPSGLCLTDWREVWLRDCFWHVLFAFILLVVMIIWRPSSNRSRFAYSLVTDEEEVVFEQGSNKNFETVKMRSVNKGDTPPAVTSQAEDDLRWVEENLPTTAMDKALPLLLDSDEEVMTTKFEMSKMN